MQGYEDKALVIPARPEVLQTLTQLVNDSDPGIDKVAALIKTDVSLYANTLALINSAYIGLRSRVTCINTAVRIMGVKRTLTVVKMASLRSSLSQTGRLDQFWDEANMNAVICSQLSKYLPHIPKDDAYTLGMMCSCAVPLLYKQLKGYKSFYEEDSLLDLPEQQMHEQVQFGVDRFEASRRIAEVWKVPEILCRVIALQPRYQTVLAADGFDETEQNILAVLILAKELSLKFSTLWGCSAEEYQPVTELESVLEQLCLTESDLVGLEQALFDSLELGDFGVSAHG